MKKYTIYLPDDVIQEIDSEVQALKTSRPDNMTGNIGRGTVITQAWYRLKVQRQRK